MARRIPPRGMKPKKQPPKKEPGIFNMETKPRSPKRDEGLTRPPPPPPNLPMPHFVSKAELKEQARQAEVAKERERLEGQFPKRKRGKK